MKTLAILVISAVLFGCASETAKLDTPSPVLEPVDPVAEQGPIEAVTPPTLAKLQAKLAELGYEGVGMDLESEEVLELLLQVFSSPIAANRKIQAVYTGAANAYDAAHESLTLGGTRDVKGLTAFIKKKVPARKASNKP